MPAATQAADVLHFWFQELDASRRFAKDVALDEAIRQRFGAHIHACGSGVFEAGWLAFLRD